MPEQNAPLPPVAPVAPARPHPLRHGGDERDDPWFWLGQRDDPEVLDHLRAENRYTAAALAHLAPLREQLFTEIVGRVQETDASSPSPHGPFEYFTRTIEGLEYPVHCRRARLGAQVLPDPFAAPGATPGEAVVVDENALAGDEDYFNVGDLVLTPSQHLVAVSTDVTGGERYTLRFRDLERGTLLDDVVPDVYYGVAWADDTTVFYTRPDEAMRPFQIWRHHLGTPAADDVLVFQEDDERFYVGVDRARSGRYLVITSASKTTSEVWLLPTAEPTAALHGGRAARAGARVPRGAPRRTRGRPALRAQQRERRRELRAPRHPHRDPRTCALAGGAPGARRGAPRRRRRVRPSPRGVGTRGWSRAPAGAGARRRRRGGRRPRGRDARRGVLGVDRHQPRVRHRHPAVPVHVAGRAGLGLRLRRPQPHVHPRASPAGARLRAGALHQPAPVGHRTRRHAGADLAGVATRRPRRGRSGPDAALRLRLLRGVDRPDVLGEPGEPARPRRGLRDRPHPRRRRARPRVVRGRQAAHQAQHVHRLRRLRRAPRGRRLDHSRPARDPRRQRGRVC